MSRTFIEWGLWTEINSKDVVITFPLPFPLEKLVKYSQPKANQIHMLLLE